MNLIYIHSLDAEEINLYTNYSENQLARINEPEPGYFVCESPEVINRALMAGYEPISFLVEKENMNDAVLKTMENCDVPVYVCEHEVIKDLPGYGLTRGMLCVMKRKARGMVLDIIKDAKSIAILEEVMNPTNIGAITRSAAALGIDAILLTSGCADPLYRRAARVSMGTVFQIPWTYIDKKTLGNQIANKNIVEKRASDGTGSYEAKNIWPEHGIDIIKELGFTVIATALLDNTLDIRDEKIRSCEKKAIILGTEGTGIKDETLSLCDYTVKIPMSHGVDSLNVAAASAVTFWEIAQPK